MNEGGDSFLTAGKAGVDRYGQYRGLPNDGRLYRVVISNDAYQAGDGAAVTGGPLGVGVGRVVSHVLPVGGSVTVRFAVLADVAWNDYGTSCQLSLMWTEEPS